MPGAGSGDNRLPYVMVGLVVVQTFCAIFFLGDVVTDLGTNDVNDTTDWHLYIEVLAALSLCAAIFVEIQYLLWLFRRKTQLEHSVSIASAAIHEVIETHFELWKLTPAEKDIATFLVKGMSISEIGKLRGSAEGTIKSHLNSIYRKSGTNGRGELLSLIIDNLMSNSTERPRKLMAAPPNV